MFFCSSQQLGDENRELRLQTDRLTAENLEKDNLIQTLKGQVVQVQTAGGSTRQDAERIQVLEHQVQLCTEDFESERHDRERAQAKIEELEQELKIVRRQVRLCDLGHSDVYITLLTINTSISR